MYKKAFILGLFIYNSVSLAETIKINNNQDIKLTLSQSNYNRVVVKNDRIIEAVFPEQAMVIKRDENDGSVYVMLNTQNPFTLFLTTEAGQHYSATISAEESLGKTFELAYDKPQLQQPIIPKPLVNPKMLTLMEHMKNNSPLLGFNIEKHRTVERWKQGLSLIHQQSWHDDELQGEIIELYNGGSNTLALNEAWFTQKTTRAIQFSSQEILPHKSATLYRVSSHG